MRLSKDELTQYVPVFLQSDRELTLSELNQLFTRVIQFGCTYELVETDTLPGELYDGYLIHVKLQGDFTLLQLNTPDRVHRWLGLTFADDPEPCFISLDLSEVKQLRKLLRWFFW